MSLVSVLLLLAVALLLTVALLLAVTTAVAVSVATLGRVAALIVRVRPSAVSNRVSVSVVESRLRDGRAVVNWGLTRRSSVPWSAKGFQLRLPTCSNGDGPGKLVCWRKQRSLKSHRPVKRQQ